jgi:hypothetical protein
LTAKPQRREELETFASLRLIGQLWRNFLECGGNDAGGDTAFLSFGLFMRKSGVAFQFPPHSRIRSLFRLRLCAT